MTKALSLLSSCFCACVLLQKCTQGQLQFYAIFCLLDVSSDQPFSHKQVDAMMSLYSSTVS